ncbi:MAG: DUF5722 domain-containing protein [Pirellulaceae bacterium]
MMLRFAGLFGIFLSSIFIATSDCHGEEETPDLSAQWRQYLSTQFPAEITEVKVDGSRVLVRGTLAPGRDGQKLVEIEPHHSSLEITKWDRTYSVSTNEDGRFEVTLNRTDQGYDRIYSRWAVVAEGEQPANRKLLSSARYAADVSSAAKWPEVKRQRPKSAKGMGGVWLMHDLNDLVELGVHNITLNLMLENLLQVEGTSSHRVDYGGETFYMRESHVRQLDEAITFAWKNDIVVSVIILIPRKSRETEIGRRMTHPDAVDGHYSMANLTSREGANTYAALMRFLAERYGHPEGPHGRITHWIIHNEVNSGWIWTNSGKKDMQSYLDEYDRSMRLVYHSARAFNPEAEVFISLDHFWNQVHRDAPGFYSTRELMEQLVKRSEREGDYQWGVAHHPYPQNLRDPKVWLDTQPTDDYDTPKITFYNIEVLDRWMQEPENLYQGKPRTVLLSEQGFDTPPQADGEDLQAAALVYAWNKIKDLPTVEAKHYHRWIDHEHEGGLLLGLWTVRPGSITLPLAKKKSWSVFQALDTPEEKEVNRFARPILGAVIWDRFYED